VPIAEEAISSCVLFCLYFCMREDKGMEKCKQKGKLEHTHHKELEIKNNVIYVSHCKFYTVFNLNITVNELV
jgi:hypothetical protein